MAHSPIKQLYEKLQQASEISIIESADIISKGMYLSEGGKKEIHIKRSLSHSEKLKVLLHEYSHYIHLTYYFKQESRSECEMIANGSAFFICREFELKVCKGVELSKFSTDTETVKRLRATMQSVAAHILKELNPT